MTDITAEVRQVCIEADMSPEQIERVVMAVNGFEDDDLRLQAAEMLADAWRLDRERDRRAEPEGSYSMSVPAFGEAPLTGVLPANMSQEALWIVVAEAIGCEVAELHDWVIVAELKDPDPDERGVHGKIVSSRPDHEVATLRMLRQSAANLGRVLGR